MTPLVAGRLCIWHCNLVHQVESPFAGFLACYVQTNPNRPEGTYSDRYQCAADAIASVGEPIGEGHDCVMDPLCAEPANALANGTSIVLQWTAAGGRVIESKQKQLFVAPDGTLGI